MFIGSFKVLEFQNIGIYSSCPVQVFTSVHLFKEVLSCLCPFCESFLHSDQEELFLKQKGEGSWHKCEKNFFFFPLPFFSQ